MTFVLGYQRTWWEQVLCLAPWEEGAGIQMPRTRGSVMASAEATWPSAASITSWRHQRRRHGPRARPPRVGFRRRRR
ncbi:hypothetical protein [Kibdelosporangium phytohabitans]|uniref:hypothetical protein n=1 Tax=Kibdelosporangium phytohabitans TaxID=860235 RepID=UPI0012F79011|nr:hypothetical protein [Kibdelosporangium phytohabitans]MBE1462184.1 hypothetical protein [Kibdelosporangium phytohabitans]